MLSVECAVMLYHLIGLLCKTQHDTELQITDIILSYIPLCRLSLVLGKFKDNCNVDDKFLCTLSPITLFLCSIQWQSIPYIETNHINVLNTFRWKFKIIVNCLIRLLFCVEIVFIRFIYIKCEIGFNINSTALLRNSNVQRHTHELTFYVCFHTTRTVASIYCHLFH